MLVLYACDFEYDGRYLSDYNFIICDFDASDGANDVSAGSAITFNTISRHSGKLYSLTSTQYDECITATFDICKNPDIYDQEEMEITNDEYRDVMRWLNRREFLKFHAIDEEYNNFDRDTCFYNASFNVEKIKINEKLYGMRLTMETDKPFGYAQECTTSWTISDVTKAKTLYDTSDEIGYTYPSMTITCNEAGNLTISNDLTNSIMVINNVSVGEVITIDGSTHIIETSLSGHKIYDDFNFEFFKIGNTIENRNNNITVSLPCKLEISYSPIIKDTPD